MRYFCKISAIDDASGVPVVQFGGRAWDGASTLSGFSGQISVGINDTEVDIKKAVIDYVATAYSVDRKDVVLVG